MSKLPGENKLYRNANSFAQDEGGCHGTVNICQWDDSSLWSGKRGRIEDVCVVLWNDADSRQR